MFSDGRKVNPGAISFSVAVVLLLGGCSRAPQHTPEVVAIVPFEGLAPEADPLLGREVAYVAVARTEGDKAIRVMPAATLGEARNAGATRVLTGWCGVRNGTARLHGTIRDLNTQKVIRTFEASGAPSDYAKLGETVAKETGAAIHEWPQPRRQAFELYIKALGSATPAEQRQMLEQAVDADPAFGAAQLALIEIQVRSNDRVAAEAQLAKASSARFEPPERARFDLIRAQLGGDGKAAVAALRKIADSGIADVPSLKGLMQAEITQQDLQSAAQTASRILELAPDDEQTLNERAYLWAFNGDLGQARKALDDYAARYPNVPNTYDSAGEILFYFRRYDEATGKFAKAYELNRNLTAEPFRAALSLHLAGKTDQADATLKPLLDQLNSTKPEEAAMVRSLWAYVSGRSSQWPSTTTGLAMKSLATLASGDRPTAAALAQKARAAARDASEANLSGIAGFLSQPSTRSQEWAQRVSGVIKDSRQEEAKAELLGWALFLDSHFAEAADAWQWGVTRVAALTPNYNQFRIAATCAQVKAGNTAAARKLMPDGWLPPSGLQPGVSVLLYRMMPELRAKF